MRIGVFICHCGSNIAGTVDCAQVAAIARSMKEVGFTFLSFGVESFSDESLAAVFRRKRLYRYGVLGCCILAFGSYYLGLPRPAALVLLTCAGLCQYGVWRERTSCFFPQGAAEAGPPTSAMTGEQATAEQTNECSGTGLPVQSLPL